MWRGRPDRAFSLGSDGGLTVNLSQLNQVLRGKEEPGTGDLGGQKPLPPLSKIWSLIKYQDLQLLILLDYVISLYLTVLAQSSTLSWRMHGNLLSKGKV